MQGRFKVWIGFLRTPPAAATGYDISATGAAAIIAFMVVWIFNYNTMFGVQAKRFVGECVRVNTRPQAPNSKCQTAEERQEYVDKFLTEYWYPKYYKEEDEEEDEDDE